MKKALNIAWKDMILKLRDPSALILMLAAPLALTIAVGFAFGGFGKSSAGIPKIPIAIVNYDEGQFSPYLVEAFESDELLDLVDTTIMEDENEARKLVDDDELAAALIIPDNFSNSIMPEGLENGDYSMYEDGAERETSEVEIYGNPTRPISSGVIRSITNQIILEFTSNISAGQLSVGSLVTSGVISIEEIEAYARQLGEESAEQSIDQELISLNIQVKDQKSESSSFLDYYAVGMAIMFLMFSMSSSARTILSEREEGTLPRMLISPTQNTSVLGGKMLGTYLTGLLQMAVLIIANRFLFGVHWGEPLAVILVTLTLVSAAAGWGLVVAAYARNPGQAGAAGMIINLFFAVLAGNFLPRSGYPLILQKIGLITPNAWGIESYHTLIAGGTLADVVPGILALLFMTVLLFGISIFLFRRQTTQGAE